MKCCSSCYRLYKDDAGFCPVDGEALKELSSLAKPKDPDDPRIGDTLCDGRYEVWRKVADGGMGRVYQALDTEEQRSVAVKVLHSDVAQDVVAVERFKREYALSSELPHEHIVEVFDFQETEDESYALVMEYLEGEELRHLLKREGKLSTARVVRVLSQLAIGLNEPHKRKLVHRDIKPDNVFLVDTPDGPLVKLLDFGSVRDNSEGAKKLTVIGTTIGSPFYMSPEQAQGLPDLDHRADVWSLAAIAYECLTAEVPFIGNTGPAILLAILDKDPVPPSTIADEVPETIDDVIADALAKNALTRTESVDALADAFGAAYGLEEDHQEWAYLPESDIKQRVEAGLKRLREHPPSAVPSTLASADGHGAADDHEIDDFDDENFVMGLPQRPPLALYVGIAVALAVLIGIVIKFLL